MFFCSSMSVHRIIVTCSDKNRIHDLVFHATRARIECGDDL
jgi:hypothetical protein